MSPFSTFETAQPWWVQVVENALTSPAVGWVTTTFSAAKILPPFTGMSASAASPAAPPPAVDEGVGVA
jgi:hypothetical protein